MSKMMSERERTQRTVSPPASAAVGAFLFPNFKLRKAKS